jgi:hypothetical protein
MTIVRQRLCKHRLKAEQVEPERMSISEQRFGNYVLAATNSNERVHMLGNGSISTFPLQRIATNESIC